MTERETVSPPSIPGIDIPAEFAGSTTNVKVVPHAGLTLDEIKEALADAGVADPERAISQAQEEIRQRVGEANKNTDTPVKVDEATKNPRQVLTYVISNAPIIGLSPDAFDTFVAAVEGQGSGSPGAPNPVPLPGGPLEDGAYATQLNDFIRQALSVFAQDPEVIKAVLDATDEVLPGAFGGAGGTDLSELGGFARRFGSKVLGNFRDHGAMLASLGPLGVGATATRSVFEGAASDSSGESFDVTLEKYLRENNVTIESFAAAVASKLDPDSGDGELFDYLVQGYRDGWLTEQADSPDFDPKNILGPVLEANNSEKLKPSDEPDPLEQPIVAPDPYTSFNLEGGATEAQDSLNQLISSEWFQALAPADRARLLEQVTQTHIDTTAQAIWQQSQLAGKLNDPLDPNFDTRRAVDQAVLARFDAQQIGIDIRTRLEPHIESLATTPTFDAAATFSGELRNTAHTTFTNIIHAAIGTVNAATTDTAKRLVNRFAEVTAAAGREETSSTALDASAAQQALYSMPDDVYRDLQYKMYLGGAYGATDPADIPWGERDDAVAFQAWNQAILQSSLANQRGVVLTVRDVLDRAISNAEATDPTIAALEAQRVTEINPDVRVSDPVSIGLTAEKVAQAVLGRRATADEKRLLVTLIQGRQTRDGVAAARRSAASQNKRIDEQVKARREEKDNAAAEAKIRSGSITDEQVTNITEAGGGEFVGPALGERNTALDGLKAQQATDEQGTGADVTVGEVTVTPEFNPRDAMEQYFRDNNSAEATAQDLRGVLDNFNRIMQGA